MTRLPDINDDEALALLPPQEAGNIRLLQLAALLETVEDYDQETYYFGPSWDNLMNHRCGAPACALGHWAVANGHRGWFNDRGMPARHLAHGSTDEDPEYEEFQLTDSERNELFMFNGCGEAGNDAKAAACYIREFVEMRRGR